MVLVYRSVKNNTGFFFFVNNYRLSCSLLVRVDLQHSQNLFPCVVFKKTNVAVFHNIFFTFCSYFTSSTYSIGSFLGGPGFVPIFEGIGFTANEMFLKITMNCTSCFWCCKSTTNRPLSNFIRTASKKRLPVLLKV